MIPLDRLLLHSLNRLHHFTALLGMYKVAFFHKWREHAFDRILHDFDFICFIETHLYREDRLDSLIDHDTWIVVRAERVQSKRASGGLLVLIRRTSNLRLHVIYHEQLEMLAFVFEQSQFPNLDCPLILCCVHFPPHQSLDESIREHLSDFIAEHMHKRSLLFIGDSNARVGNRDDQIHDVFRCDTRFVDSIAGGPCSLSMDGTLNNRGRLLLDIVRMFNLLIMNGRVLPNEFTNFTKYFASIPDVWFVHRCVLHIIEQGRIHDYTEYSDHCVISFVIPFLHSILPTSDPSPRLSISHKCVQCLHSNPLRLARATHTLSSSTHFHIVCKQLFQIAGDSHQPDRECLSHVCSEFMDCVETALDPFLILTDRNKTPMSASRNCSKHPVWFDWTAKYVKHQFKISRQHFKKYHRSDSRFTVALHDMNCARKL